MYVRQGKNPTTYYLTYTRGSDITGQKERFYRTLHDITSRKQLKQEMKRFEREVDDGLVLKTRAGITLAELCQRMLNEYISVDLKETSIRGYQVIVDRIAQYPIARAKADRIEPTDMQKFVQTLSTGKKQYSAKTIRNTLSFISNCYDIGITAKLVTHNPCAGVRLPKAKKKEARALSLDELPVFLMHLDELEPDIKLMFELGLFLGLRRSEICGIREEHIHDDYIEIVETRHEIKDKDAERKTIITDTKTAGSAAYVAVPQFLMVDIQKVLEYHEAQKNALQGIYEANRGYLILDSFGRPISPYLFNSRLQAYIKRIGIDHVTFHQLRHTYASLVNELGANIVELSAQMRHANADITLNTYTHLVRSVSDSSRKFADKMDSFVNSLDGKRT